MKKHVIIFASCFFALAISLTSCQGINGNGANELKASGIISATEINIASQIGGTIVTVKVDEGSQVKKGDALFKLDDALLQAQRDQASDAVTVAEKAVNSARIQYDIAVNNIRLQDQQNRINSWNISQPEEFDLLVWYFDKEEKINSAKSEVDAAAADLDIEKENLKKVLAGNSSQDLLSAEQRLAEAQAAFLIADQVLTQANDAQDKEDISNYANDLYDTVKTELSSAQTDYNCLSTTQAATEVLEAWARARGAQERMDRAVDYLTSLESGDQTVDGRKTTVYAVKITVPNTNLKLKPGMPADVIFIEK